MDKQYISPLLRDRIQKSAPVSNIPVSNPVSANYAVQKNADLNAVYENLKLHAGEAKPNEAKAKLVNDNFIKRQINAIKDTNQDCKNYFKAITTGDVNDTQLGRINDVGLKLGAALIAAFLALNTKNKKVAAMEFIGATTFLATMSAWPKLFINLPARLVHGFSIDKKYISAQGEKKDFFLDNQFIPWDVYTKEDLAKIGKKTGIDINSPNGEEKIKRKMQKTALQNRTLWMATAGFATPLMTSMVCSLAEPCVEKGLTKHEYNKVQRTISDKGSFIKDAKRVVKKLFDKETEGSWGEKIKAAFTELFNPGLEEVNAETTQKAIGETIGGINSDHKAVARATKKSQAELDKLFKNKESDKLGADFFDKLASKLDFSGIADEFENNGDFDALSNYSAKERLSKELKVIYDDTATYTEEDLLKALSKLTDKKNLQTLPEDAIQKLEKLKGKDLAKALKEMGYDSKQISKVISELNNGKKLKDIKFVASTLKLSEEEIKQLHSGPLTIRKIREFLSDTSRFNQSEVDEVLGTVKVDNTKFFEKIKTFDKEVGAVLRERASAYIKKLINPVAGNTERSVYTKQYKKTIETLIDQMKLSDAQIKEIAKSDSDGKMIETLMDFFSKNAPVKGFEKDEVAKAAYEKFLKTLCDALGIPKDVSSCVGKLDNGVDMLSSGLAEGEHSGLLRAMLGEGKGSFKLVDAIKSFLKTNTTNIETFKAKILLMSGLERRIKSGELIDAFRGAGLVGELTEEDLIKLARKAIYNSSAGNAANKYGIPNGHEIFKKIVFDSGAYEFEKGAGGGIFRGAIEKALKFMSEDKQSGKEIYIGASGFADQMKKALTSINNNKTWQKIFIPATLALIAITLLVQPLFGNIKKEYPENNTNGDKQ